MTELRSWLLTSERLVRSGSSSGYSACLSRAVRVSASTFDIPRDSSLARFEGDSRGKQQLLRVRAPRLKNRNPRRATYRVPSYPRSRESARKGGNETREGRRRDTLKSADYAALTRAESRRARRPICPGGFIEVALRVV